MKATRSVLTTVVPAVVLVLLASLPLLAMVPILTSSRESQTLDVQPLDIQPGRVPTPPPVTNQPLVVATPAPAVVANAAVPQPIPVPPESSIASAPVLASSESRDLSPAAVFPTINVEEIVAMVLTSLAVLIWAWRHRVVNVHGLSRECA